MRPLLPLTLAALPTACVFPTSFDEESFEVTDPITAIDVGLPTGDVDLRGADVDEVTGQADLSWHGEKPHLTYHVEGDTLFIDVDCEHPSWYCVVHLDLEVPHGVDARIDTTTGDVLVREIDGEVEAEVTTGDIAVHDVLGVATLETVTGQIVGRGLLGETVDAHATTGDIDLVHADGFRRLTAGTTTGNVRLLVPAGTYDCYADNTTGNIEMTGIIDDPDATAQINATTTTGNIEITGYTVEP